MSCINLYKRKEETRKCYFNEPGRGGWCGTCYEGDLKPGEAGYCDYYNGRNIFV